MIFKKDGWQHTPWGAIGRVGVVLLVIALLFLLSAFPLPFGNLGDVRPAFLLMAVYYWSITRPENLSVAGVFFLGVLLDLLSGLPLGLNGLVFLSVQWIMRRQRKFMMGQPFRLIWAGLALVALGAGLCQWFLFALFYFSLPPVLPVLISATLTAFAFPLLVPLFAYVNKLVADSVDPL